MYKQELLAITYDIWISGTKLGIKKKSCITSLSIKETVTGADTLTLTISDPEFLFIEDNIFIENNKVKLKMGWDDSTYRVTFTGYISTIDINFGQDGIPVLTITCMDETQKMNRKKKNATFKGKTSASIVKQIVKNYGFKCKVEEKYNYAKQGSVTQSNQSDIEFITRLAGNEVYPFTARLVGDTFHYEKMGKLTTPKMTLNYGKYPNEVISFSPKINKATRQVEAKSSRVNSKSKSISTTKGKSGDTTKQGGVTSNGSTPSATNETTHTYHPEQQNWSRNDSRVNPYIPEYAKKKMNEG